jgi:hypothetical protein
MWTVMIWNGKKSVPSGTENYVFIDTACTCILCFMRVHNLMTNYGPPVFPLLYIEKGKTAVGFPFYVRKHRNSRSREAATQQRERKVPTKMNRYAGFLGNIITYRLKSNSNTYLAQHIFSMVLQPFGPWPLFSVS